MTKILIFEDDLETALHWRDALEEAGYSVIHEAEFKNACDVLSEDSIDLVLSDMLIRNPDGGLSSSGGLSLLSHIALNVVPRPSVIGITGAHSSLNVSRHAELFKPNRMLEKPIESSELVRIVGEVLNEPHSI